MDTRPAPLITRRPIFDRSLEVVAYELLAAPESAGSQAGPDRGAARVLVQGVLSHGLKALTGGKPLHVRASRRLLLDGHVSLLPPEAITVRIGDDVTADAEVVAALTELRTHGYRLLLSDFRADDPRAALNELVDGVVVDFRALTGSVRSAALRAAPRDLRHHVAEHVDDYDDFVAAFDLGCVAAQGDFFAHATPVEGAAAPGFKPVHLQLLEAAQRSELDFNELEQLVKRDLQLTHQFLRYVNAAAFGWRRRIDSLQHAFVLLGESAVRKWIALVLLADLASDRPQQLAVTASVRARFCELLGERATMDESGLELFMVGMFSLLNVVLGRPMKDAVRGLPISPDVQDALVGYENPLRRVLDTVLAYESGDWDELTGRLEELGIEEDDVFALYLSAVDWAAGAFDPSPDAEEL